MQIRGRGGQQLRQDVPSGLGRVRVQLSNVIP